MAPVTDFTKYQPPGVYVSEVSGGAASGGFGQETVIALVGKAIGYNSATEQFTLTGTTAAEFAQPEIVGDPIVYGVETGITYAPTTDYVITETAGETPSVTITRVETQVTDEAIAGLSGTIPVKVANPAYIKSGSVVLTSNDGNTTYSGTTDYTVDYAKGTIQRKGSTIPVDTPLKIDYKYCRIADGNSVAVTYDYAPTNYHDVFLFADYEDVTSLYGQPLDDDGAVQSELSLGAYFAFLNGASLLYCVAVEAATGTPNILEWEAAVDKLETVSGIDVVVPVTGDVNVHSSVVNHVNTMVANSEERRTILGRDGSSTAILSSTLISAAGGYENERVSLISPASIGYFNPLTNSVDTVGSQYVACAVAGITSRQAPYVPLTMKQLAGFHSMTENRSKAVKNSESRSGLMVIEGTATAPRIRHGLTTDVSTTEKREFSVVFAKDKMMRTLREDFDGLVGQPISDITVPMARATATAVLDRLVYSGYINEFLDVKVRQNSFEPTMIEVKFAYKPTYPLNYVYVQFSVDLSSGSLTL